ncbi:uncharacterized protein LOC110901199 [Helianthus annuus]|uniref:uncharacterized protein LOC110901199 n=1 Tax=Helianthus annuus TaxID=4232 RepID=UPI000B908AE6|nr:uncharacterized protein LOC110901199 [Helianthus annuus]
MSSSSSSGSTDTMDAVKYFINNVVEATQLILEEEEEEEVSSQPRNRNPHIDRDRESANQRLFADYFADEPLYSEAIFRRRFRMSRRLFLRIADDLAAYHPFFTLRPDARGKMRFTTLQKCTAVIRQLAYGTAADAWDEYLKMSERTAREWIGPYTRFTVSGVEYRRGYYLADGIYPQYSTTVKTVRHPPDEKRKKFVKFQESARKDIERCFGFSNKDGILFKTQYTLLHPKRCDTVLF